MVAECDELDGVKDGLIENPLRCDFDIATLTCAANQNTSTCLSDLQIDAIKTIYAGPHDARTNASLYPGMGISSELGWTELLGVLAEKFSIPILQNLVMNNLSYDATTFNWASDVDLVNEKAGRFIDEVSPDLSAFRARGGKLIVTQGWSDPLNAAKWPLEHLYQIKDNFGGDVSEWLEVFMVPGIAPPPSEFSCQKCVLIILLSQVAAIVASDITHKHRRSGTLWRNWYNGPRREKDQRRCSLATRRMGQTALGNSAPGLKQPNMLAMILMIGIHTTVA